ncbi:MAG TPA: PEGA domain-containing protein [bacterium]|nr:PEGA domain-containing protein [bacterium]
MKNKEVANNKRTKKLPKIIMGQLFFAITTCLLAVFLIYYAQGYRLNTNTFRLVKTGLVFLDFLPKNAQVLLNNREQECSSPCALNLIPGIYQLTISKTGFQQWSTPSIYVDSESVNAWKNILLFRNDVTGTELTDPSEISLLSSPIDALAKSAEKDLQSNTYEIWVGGDLVTRLSTPIGKTIWYPDFNHVIYQQDREIRIIETNGNNDQLLVKLENVTTSNFIVASRGEELFYTDGTKFMRARIR